MPEEKGWMVPTLQLGGDFFLLEDWDGSPAGPYRAVFHFTPDGRRTLFIDREAAVEVISSIHRFDEIHVTDIVSERQGGKWVLEAETGKKGPLRLEVDYVETGALKVANALASLTPDVVSRSRVFCSLMPRLAAVVMGTDPKQRITGVTEIGTGCRFRVERMFKVERASATWGGKDVGDFVECTLSHDLGDFSPVSKAMVSRATLFFEQAEGGPRP